MKNQKKLFPIGSLVYYCVDARTQTSTSERIIIFGALRGIVLDKKEMEKMTKYYYTIWWLDESMDNTRCNTDWIIEDRLQLIEQ